MSSTAPAITPAAGLLLGVLTLSVGLYVYFRPSTQSSDEISKTFDNYSAGSRPKTPPRGTGSSTSTGGGSSSTTTSGTSQVKEEEEEVEVDPYPCGPMRVYFGSQTGTAEEFATTLVEEGKARGFDAKIVDLEDFEEDDFMNSPLSSALHMFAVATYGEGDPTDNALDFYKWLKKDCDELPSELKFCVFGLGNTQYEHFNATGRNINKLLEKKGGTRVADYGEGDDDGSMEDDFEQWRDQLWPQLTQTFGNNNGGNTGDLPSWKPSYSVTWMEASVDNKLIARKSAAARKKVTTEVEKGMNSNDPDKKITLSSQSYFYAKEVRVVSNSELRKDGGTIGNGSGVDQDGNFGSTVQVEFDLSASGLTYNTADTLAVCPENDPELVNKLCAWQEWEINAHFLHRHLSHAGQKSVRYKALFPSPISVKGV